MPTRAPRLRVAGPSRCTLVRHSVHLARDGDGEDAAASDDRGSDELRRELMPATLMRCLKSQN